MVSNRLTGSEFGISNIYIYTFFLYVYSLVSRVPYFLQSTSKAKGFQ